MLALATDALISTYCRGEGGFEQWERPPTHFSAASPKRCALHLPDVPRKRRRIGVDELAHEDAVVKQDGQKKDSAPVPIRLWDGMFAESLEEQSDPPELVKTWRPALGFWRNITIKWWKRYLVRSFWRHIRKSLPSEQLESYRTGVEVVPTWRDGQIVYQWAQHGRSNFQSFMRLALTFRGTKRDWGPGRECIDKASYATWWDWRMGSRLFFWQWERKPYRKVWDEDPNWLPPWARGQDKLWARDGQPHFQVAKFPTFRKPQIPPRTPQDRVLVQAKVGPVRMKEYMEQGPVKGLAHYFYVPKGEEDIRMVYNGTSCGLNDCLFAPHFGLPVIEHVMRSVLPGYHQADIDIGEMFLNFILGENVRAYSGVDVFHLKMTSSDLGPDGYPPEWWAREESPLEWEEQRRRMWELWCRNWMGCTDSPWRSIQMIIIAKVIAYGDRTDPNNPFQWELAVLNLPGSADYDPTLPWVYKLRVDLRIANEIYVYVNDGRSTGATKLECWRGTRRFASVCSHLSIQDAARKRTEPSTTPGPWAGSLLHTNNGITTTVTQKKWDKVRAIVHLGGTLD